VGWNSKWAFSLRWIFPFGKGASSFPPFEKGGQGGFRGICPVLSKDGLVHNWVNAIDHDENGALWIGTQGGVSCYDGKEFLNFTTKDGLAHNEISAIHCEKSASPAAKRRGASSALRDKDGLIWFGTSGGGVSCYDRKSIVNITTADGLVNNKVRTIHCDPNGALWFGTDGGVSRLLRESAESREPELVRFPPLSKGGRGDFLSLNKLRRPRKRKPELSPPGRGWGWVGFLNFTPKDGLAHEVVYEIEQTPDGILWFGHHIALSRYDGHKFDTLDYNGYKFYPIKEEDFLLSGYISAMSVSPDGTVWLAAFPGIFNEVVVFRYDGKSFKLFNPAEFANRGGSCNSC